MADQTNQTPNKKSTPFITQESIAPAAIKQRHLVASPTQVGDMYYGKDGNSFANLSIGANGSVLYSTGSAPVWLTIGSSSQVLTVSGGLPVWATPASRGNTINLYTNSTTTGGSTSSTSFVDIPNCVTPSVTTTKISNVLLTFSTSTFLSNTATANFQIVRGSTVLSAAFTYDESGSAGLNQIVSFSAVDASLAAGTYTWKVQYKTSANTLTANPNVITALVIQ